MPFRLLPIMPVLLGAASTQIALGIMSTLVPLLLVQGGVSAPVIGLVGSAYYMGFLCGALLADRVVAAVGHIRAFAVFAAIAADAALLMAFTGSPWAVAAFRALIGFSTSGVFLVAESWLNSGADPDTRGRTFAAYLIVSWGGSAVGPMLLNAVGAAPLAFVLVGAAFATALIPMGLTRQPNPPIRGAAHVDLAGLYRTSPVGVVLCAAAGLLNSSFYALMPVYLQGQGQAISDRAVAVFMSSAMIAGLAVQYPIGLIGDRLGRRPTAVALLLVGLVMALILGGAGLTGLPALLAFGCTLAGMTAPLYGLGSGQTNDRIQDGSYVAAAGGLLFAWSLGSTVGPTLAGWAMGALGGFGLFVYLAVVLGGVALFTALRMVQRNEVPRDQRSAFVPSNAAPPRLTELVSDRREARVALDRASPRESDTQTRAGVAATAERE